MKITKAHRICFILASCGPLPRVEIVRRLHVLEARKSAFHPGHSSDYFRRGPRDNDRWLSPCARGLFVVVEKRRNTFIYDVTPEGHKLANEFLGQ